MLIFALSNSNHLLNCDPESNTTGMPEGHSSLFVCDCKDGFCWLMNPKSSCTLDWALRVQVIPLSAPEVCHKNITCDTAMKTIMPDPDT